MLKMKIGIELQFTLKCSQRTKYTVTVILYYYIVVCEFIKIKADRFFIRVTYIKYIPHRLLIGPS